MTTMPKAQEISRKWYIIDAANRPLGRTAAAAAAILRGKHKVDFAPHVDCGDHVNHHQRREGNPHRQEDRAEVLPPSLRLGRRPQGESATHQLMA